MKKIIILLFIMGIILTPLYAQADIILAPGHTWEYTFTNPTGDTTWNTVTGGGWDTGPAPFGNNSGGFASDPMGYFDYATYWEQDGTFGDDDLWVRTAIDLTGFDLSTLTWDLGVDNGFKLYANGNYIDGDNAGWYTARWEYSGNFSGVSLNQGVNIFAVALDDWGTLTAFDMQITGSPGAPVPEPATMFLFGTGLVGLVGFRKRSKRLIK